MAFDSFFVSIMIHRYDWCCMFRIFRLKKKEKKNCGKEGQTHLLIFLSVWLDSGTKSSNMWRTSWTLWVALIHREHKGWSLEITDLPKRFLSWASIDWRLGSLVSRGKKYCIWAFLSIESDLINHFPEEKVAWESYCLWKPCHYTVVTIVFCLLVLSYLIFKIWRQNASQPCEFINYDSCTSSSKMLLPISFYLMIFR